MIILISPSKTMRQTKEMGNTTPMFWDEADKLMNKLKAMDETTLEKAFSLSPSLAAKTQEMHADFEPRYRAIEAYTGAQFKSLDIATLSVDAVEYLGKHLYIISGLYGLVRPEDSIGLYRLPMGERLDGTSLASFWRAKLFKVLVQETVVLNLASGEYAAALDNQLAVYHVKFEKASSMLVKQLRGKMVRQLAERAIASIDAVKRLKVGDYVFSHVVEETRSFVFVQTKK